MLQILDEVYRILHYIEVTPKLSRPYKVTDELFDLSTMAMEYFKDHIEPLLPEITYFAADFLDFSGTFSCEYWQFCWSKPALRSVKYTRLYVFSHFLSATVPNLTVLQYTKLITIFNAIKYWMELEIWRFVHVMFYCPSCSICLGF